MKARQHFQMVTSASTEAPEPAPEPSVEQIEREVTEAINGVSRYFDSSVYVEWLCTRGDVRVSSKTMGYISTDEMLMLLAHPDTSAISCKQIGEEIRRRFTDAYLEGLTAAAEKCAKQSADDAEEADFERRFCHG